MPGSATLPRMRHLLEYLSRTFDNRHLAIYLKTISVMNCDCLAFSCNWAQPKSHLYKQRSATTSLSNFMPESATLPCMRHSLGFTVLQYLYQPPVSWTVNAWRSLAIEHSRNVCRHRTKKDIYIYKRHNVCRRRTKPIYKRHFVKYIWVHTTTFHLQHDPTLVISLQTASLTEPTVQYIPNLKPWQRRLFATSPIDTATPQENQRLETRHVGAKKRAFRARLPPILIFSTCYQTGWNVTECHACHAKQHDNLLGNIRKGHVFQLPP